MIELGRKEKLKLKDKVHQQIRKEEQLNTEDEEEKQVMFGKIMLWVRSLPARPM